MEVGAVKQAFNNEVIHLKKSLNQARIQIIHKLTRKAKTLVGKKKPEQLQEKLKRKAESAVKEVLIIKKIKPKDIAKFAVTHKGELSEYLNKPTIDNDKACARLLLHKALEDKYIHIRTRYSGVSINDLLMTREERRKLKKEQRENAKNKKKNKEVKKQEWSVEDVGSQGGEKNSGDEEMQGQSSEESDEDEVLSDEGEVINDKDEVINDDDEVINDDDEVMNDDDDAVSEVEDDDAVSEVENEKDEAKDGSSDERNNVNVGKFVKNPTKTKTDVKAKPTKQDNRTKLPKTNKDKHRKIEEKIQAKKLRKNDEDPSTESSKVVDPFFITATGENYMSLCEPRAPDEVKEVHKQGNRQYRRARMFGHEPRVKPRQNFKNNYDNSNSFRRNDTRNNKDFDSHNSYNNKEKFSKNGTNRFSKPDFDRNVGTKRPADEKLHPSWEAKKKISSIQPFQGKKIVFDS